MDLEKVHDMVPKEMVMVMLRQMGVMKAEVGMVESMYEGTKGRVMLRPGMSEEFRVNIGLIQV